MESRAAARQPNESPTKGTNVRVGWLDTAGTGLFVVWNDTNHRGSLERTGIIAGPRQRQLVIKYSKLFNLTR